MLPGTDMSAIDQSCARFGCLRSKLAQVLFRVVANVPLLVGGEV